MAFQRSLARADRLWVSAFTLPLLVGVAACSDGSESSSDDGDPSGVGGTTYVAGGAGVGGSFAGATGGAFSGSGGTFSSGGVTASGGAAATGGALATGGVVATGGEPSTGGTTSTGGGAATGGASSTGGSAGSCPGDSSADLALVGYATQAGGTTGGKGGATITVTTGAELVQALKDKKKSTTPLTILINGKITVANSGVEKIDVKEVEDVSLIGLGAGAEFDGIGVKVYKASNIVLRNLKIHNVLAGDKDAISIEGPADHIWVDHCELYAQYQGVDKDYYDGLLDAKAETQYVTYSWNYLHDSWKMMLVGSSESDTFDRKLTIHHNRFENVNSRLPLFRGGTGHIFNNFYSGVESTAINSRLGACLLIENNVFNDVLNPWVSAYSDTLGGGEVSCNVLSGSSSFVYSSDTFELPTCNASVPYDYQNVLNDPASVESIVKANAGVGKLQDPKVF